MLNTQRNTLQNKLLAENQSAPPQLTNVKKVDQNLNLSQLQKMNESDSDEDEQSAEPGYEEPDFFEQLQSNSDGNQTKP